MSEMIFTTIPLDVENSDGTIFMKDSFLGKDIYDKIGNGMMMGELGHPSSFETTKRNVTHKIDNIEIIDDIYCSDLLVSASLIDTEAGRRVKDMLDDGATFRLSPRGKMKYDRDGEIIGYMLFTFDLMLIEKPTHFSDL